ncbi:MAG: (4Fe-4S)-binding protein [Armatimonadetes bacterium]|nr:(4Fe-4S)-binding protein [Armatimonadota bacterium]MBS1728860.1 (4Fe-4S)-binding protein [Armatimonadota bacterium]
MDRHVERDYESDDLTVHWRSAKCVHCGNCVRGLSTVFDLQRHPWIDMEGATSDEIVAQIEKCPSGALSFTRKR